MPVVQDFGAHGEFGHGERNGDASGVAMVAVADTLPPKLLDLVAIAAPLSRADSLTPKTTEITPSVVAVLSRVESLLAKLTELSSLRAVLFRADTVSPRSDDVARLMAQWLRTDSLLPRTDAVPVLRALLVRQDTLLPMLADLRTVFTTIARTETLLPKVSEARTLFAALTTVSDSLALVLADHSAVYLFLARGDTVAVKTDASVVAPIAVRLLRADTASVVVDRYSKGPGFGAHGEFAMGEHYLDHHGEDAIRERLDIFARLSRADTTLVRLDSASLVATVLTRLEALLARIDEGDTRAEERLHRRIINIIQY